MLASAKVQRGLLCVLVALVAAIVVVLVTGRAGSRAAGPDLTPSSHFDGNAMPAHLQAPSFSLINQDDRRVSLAQDRGRVVVLTFIYAHCKNSCPFMVEQIRSALSLLPDQGRAVRVIGVSVEPRADTMSVRRQFLAVHQMTGRMQYLDGPVPVMRRVWKSYGIAPETPTSEHSAFVLLINRQGEEQVGFSAVQLTSSGLAHDIRVLLDERD